MLVIRNAQVTALGQVTRDGFEEELTAFVLKNYPRESRQAGGPAQIRIFVRQGIAAAESFGLGTQRELRIFVALMLMLGADFPRDFQIPWAAEALAETSFPDATLRCEHLFGTALSYLEATAGKRGELIVRALLRVRAFDLRTVPSVLGAAWVTEVCGIWKRLYPEKFEFQGEAICRALIEHAIPRAHACGLHDAVGIFLHATLMFFAGIGYDRDPLHPWATAVLAGGSGAPDPGIGQRLYAAAMEHLEQSLTSS